MFMTYKDLRVIVYGGAGLAGFGMAMWLAFGQASLPVLLALGVMLLVLLQLELYRRMQHQAMVHHRQVEATANLTSALPLRRPLPPMRDAVISPDCASVLVNMVLDRKPGLILEFGSGVSTVLQGYALEEIGRGRILSLDHLEMFAGITRENVERHGLSDRAEVVHAPMMPMEIQGRTWKWYQMPRLGVGTVDVVVVDGPPDDTQDMARYPALPAVYPYLSKDAVILIDDADREAEQRMVDRWLAEFPEFQKQYIPTEKGTVILRRVSKAAERVAEAA